MTTPDPHTRTAKATSATDAEFTEFYRASVKPLVAFLILQGATLAEAADVAQETMTKAYQRWETLDHPHAWTRRVASREFIRQRVNQPETPTDPLPHSPLLRTGDIEGWELTQDLVRALATLTPRQRQVMAWMLTGHTPAEIAQELGLTDGAVRQQVYLARRTISTRLEGRP
ncbi:RNA polymerase sigma factor [Actinokineospora globicatena]|uniref:HTH luxR-type domain-containing protein n=1 Tax=Actinokineospora globicatena TaxID=103729 RepID=A0A9W6V9S1_9PSEU|nr:sigma-70 family RNA polymerase sigma factor [Actinokineospora globicatena]MCP2302768.1 RNA polymerase sigma-70 factor, ECF subfamily [Actinokineospora globicatena]GLW75542.1 hypothetical protein Aglo01_00240 [Actinokineospora globicatena]GLW82383.1 hypothetical protein Aglo02_00240 [Actinokineospora globicatena]GLW91326.1 hypothetical protein Aglo03_21420 [Actinokineospora globicatena]